MADQPQDRRRYPRVRSPISCRPVSFLARALPRQVQDASVGGLRAYSDDAHRVGERLELELLFPDGHGATVLAEVVWIEALPDGAPARYDVGMRFVQMDPDDQAAIARLLQE